MYSISRDINYSIYYKSMETSDAVISFNNKPRDVITFHTKSISENEQVNNTK